MTRRLVKLALVGAVLALAACSTPQGATAPKPPPSPCPVAPTDATDCLQALMVVPGAVFNGHGRHYEVDHGIQITNPQGQVIEDASFHTEQKTAGQGAGGGTPVFTVGSSVNVPPLANPTGYNAVRHLPAKPTITFRHVTITGPHTKECGDPNGTSGITFGLFGQAGIRFNGTIEPVVHDVTTSCMEGDGIDLQPFIAKTGQRHCVQNAYVIGLTADHNGRDAFSPTCERGLFGKGLVLSTSDQLGMDFEQDFPGQVAANVWLQKIAANGIEVAEPGDVNLAQWNAPTSKRQALLASGGGTVQVDFATLAGPIQLSGPKTTLIEYAVAFQLHDCGLLAPAVLHQPHVTCTD